MNVEVYPVRPELIETVWPHAVGFLEKALARAKLKTHTLGDLYEATKRGDFVLWVCFGPAGIDAALLAEVQQTPQAKILSIPYIGGRNMKAWVKPIVAALEAWGRSVGCCALTGGGRIGWARAAGFEPLETILIRKI